MKNKWKNHLIVSFFVFITVLSIFNLSQGQRGRDVVRTTPKSGTSHLQPPATSLTSLFTAETCNSLGSLGSLPCGISDPETSFYPIRTTAINFYNTPRLVDRGYVLNENDKVCVGDTLQVYSVDLGGEWFGKGGPNDSPPITWVNNADMNQIVNNVINWHKTHTLPPETAVSSLPETVLSSREVLGMEIILYKTPLFNAPRTDYPWAYGTLICTANSEIATSGQLTGNQIKISKEGTLELNVFSEPTCLFYLEKTITDCKNGRCKETIGLYEKYIYRLLAIANNSINLQSDWIDASSITSLSKDVFLTAVKETKEPILEIVRFSLTDNYLWLTLGNNGDTTAKIDSITSSVPMVLITKVELPPYNTIPVLVQLQTNQNVDVNNLKFNIAYRSNELGCLRIKEFTITQDASDVSKNACSGDSQCASKSCCAGVCRDPSKGVCKDINGDGTRDWVPFG